MHNRKSPSEIRMQEVKHLLAQALPLIRTACELDLLVFLYRHPRALLTNEQLANFVGYDRTLVAGSVDAFIAAGFLERTQNRAHAARLFILCLDGPQGGAVKGILELASTRDGRQQILQHVAANNQPASFHAPQERLRANA